ncbi:39S ribosomal protein L34, mitochondrial [Anoplophora glabripennis]|uniref:39S ribosomal protein L34, mitochondrial n=1 Tax=Anoplophora glabripennis TaxID=217634 RepID=UPI0008742F29|nr:39S ribosomal protein L34, mitochondrial [Anoplophora glabripennis]
MFAWTRVVPSVSTYMSRLTNCTSQFLVPTSKFHSLSIGGTSQPQTSPGGLFTIPTRNVIRVHFPRPSERKRIKRHGWLKRMSTPSGRRIIMNRILKGRFVYTH